MVKRSTKKVNKKTFEKKEENKWVKKEYKRKGASLLFVCLELGTS
jgi:uncharacterized protein YgiM (DUF1202 family)